MIVVVKWQEHDRMYTIGLKEFLKKLNVDVNDAKIELTIKKLLEQQELKPYESAQHK
jgi:hypothetical protein